MRDYYLDWIRLFAAALTFIYIILDVALIIEHVHADLTSGTFNGTLSLGIFGYCLDDQKRKCYHGFLSQLVSDLNNPIS